MYCNLTPSGDVPLDVKYLWYVFPRHFFYYALKRNLEDKFVLSQNQLTKLYALSRQAESGNSDGIGFNSTSAQLASPEANALEMDIRREHEKLRGMSKSVAKLKFISMLAETEFYFCDLFKVKLGGEKLIVTVGTMGLRLINRRNSQSTKEM